MLFGIVKTPGVQGISGHTLDGTQMFLINCVGFFETIRTISKNAVENLGVPTAGIDVARLL